MDEIEIIKTTDKEIAQLQKIGRETFYETFASYNKEDDMNKYLNESFSYNKLAKEIADKNVAYYFSILNNQVVGYLKLNFGHSQTELKDNKAIEIERIYVLRKFQGKKVGQMLYEKAMQVAQQKSASYIWLGVWERNSRAINFYKKNGFAEFDKHIFKLGDDEQTDIMMKLDLKNKI